MAIIIPDNYTKQTKNPLGIEDNLIARSIWNANKLPKMCIVMRGTNFNWIESWIEFCFVWHFIHSEKCELFCRVIFNSDGVAPPDWIRVHFVFRCISLLPLIGVSAAVSRRLLSRSHLTIGAAIRIDWSIIGLVDWSMKSRFAWNALIRISNSTAKSESRVFHWNALHIKLRKLSLLVRSFVHLEQQHPSGPRARSPPSDMIYSVSVADGDWTHSTNYCGKLWSYFFCRTTISDWRSEVMFVQVTIIMQCVSQLNATKILKLQSSQSPNEFYYIFILFLFFCCAIWPFELSQFDCKTEKNALHAVDWLNTHKKLLFKFMISWPARVCVNVDGTRACKIYRGPRDLRN